MNILKWEIILFISISTLIDWVALNFDTFISKLSIYLTFLCKIYWIQNLFNVMSDSKTKFIEILDRIC